MNIHYRRRILLAGLSALLVTVSGFAQPAAAPAAGPVEYTKAQLETEQRIMRDHISDANYHIDRGIKAISANLPELAKVSVLRATGRVAQVDEVMKGHLERVERVAMVLFTPREEVRKPLRTSFEKIRDEFGALELAMYAFRKDMLRKGIFGEDLKQQVAVLDAASKLLPDLEKSNPELAAKVRGMIDQINQALASGDTAKADELIKQLTATLESSGNGGAISDAKKKIIDDAGGAGAVGGGTAGGGGAQPLAGGGSIAATAGGVALTAAGGQSVTIPGATSAGGGKITLADGTVVDPAGCTVLPDGSIKLADGRIVKDGKIVAAGPVTPRGNASLVDANGNDLGETADEFVWENGEGKGVDKVYVGGKGGRLTKETKVTVKAMPSASKANTYEVTKTPGDARQWAFVVGPVPGSDKKSSGSLTLTLALSDRNGLTGFTVTKWEITSSAGSPSLGASSGAQTTATFTASATYSIQVSGTTDWGSPFVIKSSLPVGIE